MKHSARELLSTRDAAHACGVQPATIRKWHERGKLKRYGTARDAQWRLDELVRCLTTRRQVDRHLTRCHDALDTPGSV